MSKYGVTREVSPDGTRRVYLPGYRTFIPISGDRAEHVAATVADEIERAYQAGQRDAQAAMRKALGISDE